MSDMSSMSRERKKDQLRRQMISSDRDSSERRQEQQADENIENLRRARKKARRRRLIVFIIILIIAAGTCFGIYQYFVFHQYTSYTTVWETSVAEGGSAQYKAFGDNVLKYTQDGASYIDAQGKTVWMQSYEMKSPVVSINGDYAVIADQQGNTMYICNRDGPQGTATTVLPIVKAAVAGNGITAAILEDSRASYIQYYNRDGTDMQVMVKSVLSGDGYPLDIGLSPDGTQLIVSFAYLSQGELAQRVVIYDFSEIGKNENHIVGGFDEEFKGSLVAKVVYPNGETACAFADNSITFFSTRNLADIALTKQVKVEETIESVFYSDEYAGVILQNTMGSAPYRINIYRLNGETVFSSDLDFQYQKAVISGQWVILWNENFCKVYNMQGVEKFSGELDVEPAMIVAGGSVDTLIITGQETMKEIKLK